MRDERRDVVDGPKGNRGKGGDGPIVDQLALLGWGYCWYEGEDEDEDEGQSSVE